MRKTFFVALAVLLLLPSIAAAPMARTSVYVYDVPDVSVGILESGGSIECYWSISDYDKGDSFEVDVKWYKNGDLVSTEHTSAVADVRYRASGTFEAGMNENWLCAVTATDTYSARGVGKAGFTSIAGAGPSGFLIAGAGGPGLLDSFLSDLSSRISDFFRGLKG